MEVTEVFCKLREILIYIKKTFTINNIKTQNSVECLKINSGALSITAI